MNYVPGGSVPGRFKITQMPTETQDGAVGKSAKGLNLVTAPPCSTTPESSDVFLVILMAPVARPSVNFVPGFKSPMKVPLAFVFGDDT